MSTTHERQSDRRRPGRPSVRAERRDQIVDAFLELVADRGHRATTMADVAARAGVQRSAIRHFVGTRSDLIIAGLDRLDERFARAVHDEVGSHPTCEALLAHYFGPTYIWDNAALDDAYTSLVSAAIDDDQIRARLRRGYDAELRWITELLDAPDDPAAAAIAYQIVCLVEQNAAMQRIGFDPGLAQRTQELARRLVDDFREAVTLRPAAKGVSGNARQAHRGGQPQRDS